MVVSGWEESAGQANPPPLKGLFGTGPAFEAILSCELFCWPQVN